jgi:hypothetical protein
MWHLGEIYYRLGMAAIAEHCTFEALVSSPKGPNVQTMRRLVRTNIARRDSATAIKYIGYFERSLAYRGWAQEQCAHLIIIDDRYLLSYFQYSHSKSLRQFFYGLSSARLCVAEVTAI